VLPAKAVTEAAGEEVRERFHHAERRDERKRRAPRHNSELALSDEREDRALEPDHRADERVDGNQQPELPPVGTKAESNRPLNR